MPAEAGPSLSVASPPRGRDVKADSALLSLPIRVQLEAQAFSSSSAFRREALASVD